MMVNAPRLEDRLGPNEPPYKSRGEAQVGRLLDHYGIPFFYEHPLTVHDRGRDRVWHPDFTLPQYAWLILEYAGMPDKADYMAGIRHKRNAYDTNGIPAVFIYPQDLRGPYWREEVHSTILTAYGKSLTRPAFTRYRARSGVQPYPCTPRGPCSWRGYRR